MDGRTLRHSASGYDAPTCASVPPSEWRSHLPLARFVSLSSGRNQTNGFRPDDRTTRPPRPVGRRRRIKSPRLELRGTGERRIATVLPRSAPGRFALLPRTKDKDIVRSKISLRSPPGPPLLVLPGGHFAIRLTAAQCRLILRSGASPAPPRQLQPFSQLAAAAKEENTTVSATDAKEVGVENPMKKRLPPKPP